MESTFMTYAENKLLDISGRYERRFNTGLDPDQGEEDLAMNDEIDKGYEKFADLAKDLESVLDAVWVSGTRMLTYVCYALDC